MRRPGQEAISGSIPYVYTPRYSATDAAIYLLTWSGVAVILALALWLAPSPEGIGTHQALGLPPCWFLEATGLPCPTCGLTTCFAYAAHLRFFDAARTQPFGLLQFAAFVAALPGIPWLMRQRVPIEQIALWPGLTRLAAGWTVLYLAGWAYKIAAMSGSL
ncbi:MAG: DUF2752 domain-containing protein [Bryobacteraceae bacterium]